MTQFINSRQFHQNPFSNVDYILINIKIKYNFKAKIPMFCILFSKIKAISGKLDWTYIAKRGSQKV